MAPGGVVKDWTSCMTMHIYEDIGIVSGTMSPKRGNGSYFDSESAWATM